MSGPDWLDPIIAQQAAFYGVTEARLSEIIGGAAATQERIDNYELQEDGSPWRWDEVNNEETAS